MTKTTKLSQIATTAITPGLGDNLVGVAAGTTDQLYTIAQVNSALLAVVNDGTHSGSVTLSVAASSKHKLTVSGALTITFASWPSSGTYGEIEIQLVNGGTNVTWPTVNWLVGDGTTSTLFSAMGVTLNASGTNWVIVWTTDGGTTLWGKAG